MDNRHHAEKSPFVRQLSLAAIFANGKSGLEYATLRVQVNQRVQDALPSAHRSANVTTGTESATLNATSLSVHHASPLVLPSVHQSANVTTGTENVVLGATSLSVHHARVLHPGVHQSASETTGTANVILSATSLSVHHAGELHHPQHAPASASDTSEMVTADLNAPAIHCAHPATSALGIVACAKPTTRVATLSASTTLAATRPRTAKSHPPHLTTATCHRDPPRHATVTVQVRVKVQLMWWNHMVITASHANHIVTALWGITSTSLPSHYSHSYQFMIGYYLNLVVFLNFLFSLVNKFNDL